MSPRYKPYIPQTLGDLIDKLSMMMLSSPTFADKTGYLPGRNIDSTFQALNEGLKATQSELGVGRYHQLLQMSNQTRAYFEADPEDKTGDALKGRELILDMMDLIRERGSKPRI